MTHATWNSLQKQMSPDCAAFINANVPLVGLENGSDAGSSANCFPVRCVSGKRHALGTKPHCHSNCNKGGLPMQQNMSKHFLLLHHSLRSSWGTTAPDAFKILHTMLYELCYLWLQFLEYGAMQWGTEVLTFWRNLFPQNSGEAPGSRLLWIVGNHLLLHGLTSHKTTISILTVHEDFIFHMLLTNLSLFLKIPCMADKGAQCCSCCRTH